MDDQLRIVAEPRRQEILQLIWDRELGAGEIARLLPISFSAVSQHLSKLRAAGLVTVRREGRRRFYRARRTDMGTLAIYLESLWNDRLAVLKRLAEAAEREAAGQAAKARENER